MGLGELFSSTAATTSAFDGATTGASISSGYVGSYPQPTFGVTLDSVGATTPAAVESGSSFNWSTIAQSATGLSAALGALTQLQSGATANDSAQINARINEINARMADDEAARIREAADYKEALRSRQHRRFISSARTAAAKSGAVIDSGSPLLNIQESSYLMAMDRFMEKYGMEIEATRMNNRANLLRSNAGILSYQGGVANNNAKYLAAGTLVGGLGKMGATYFGTRYRDYY